MGSSKNPFSFLVVVFVSFASFSCSFAFWVCSSACFSFSFNISYALSRSYLDGVDFFLSTRGTQRTPHERGYNPSDQRHALAIAGTLVVPWEVQIGGIAKVSSGAPMKVQAGTDLDGDTIQVGDLPPSIPITVGRTRVAESLAASQPGSRSVTSGRAPWPASVARPHGSR